MKKKIGCFCMCLVMLAAALMLSFLPCMKNSNQTASAVVEDEIGTKVDIIGINPTNYAGATIEQLAPFDDKTSQMMEGYSITPYADKYGQVNGISFSVESFKATPNKSIYMWLYLLDVDAFGLTFNVSDGLGNDCLWEFTDGEVRTFDYGWVLLELKFSDCEASATNTNVYEPTYNTFYVSYKVGDGINIEEYVAETDDRFSIYHVYLANKYNKTTFSGKVDANQKAYSKFKSDFIAGDLIFKKDEITLSNIKTVFEYLIVGKINLLENPNNSDFIWKIEALEPDGSTMSLDYGDSYMFSTQGHYTINFKLYIKRKLLNQPIDISTELIMNENKNVFCDEMALGGFMVGPDYEVYANDVLQIKFKFTPGIDVSGTLTVELSNNNAVIESEYEEDGIYYIKIKGVTAGSTTLSISANAKSPYGAVVKSYKSETKIQIKEIDDSEEQSIVLLWIAFGGFCAFFAGFLINSLVKARKNDVK